MKEQVVHYVKYVKLTSTVPVTEKDLLSQARKSYPNTELHVLESNNYKGIIRVESPLNEDSKSL